MSAATATFVCAVSPDTWTEGTTLHGVGSVDCAHIACDATMTIVPVGGTTVVVVRTNSTLNGVAPAESVLGVADDQTSEVPVGATVYAVSDSGTSSVVEAQTTPTTVPAVCCTARFELSVYVVAPAAIDVEAVIVSVFGSVVAIVAAAAVCAVPETATASPAASAANIAASNAHVITSPTDKGVVCESESAAALTGLPPTREFGASNGAVPCIAVCAAAPPTASSPTSATIARISCVR